ncbi:MauE/DoxX family redox-associated membrane protein [Catenovulum adriaticum]|uniref:Methylamine utilization protein MauE n=1 Tax=Catenovulum adriaticum TaxID=2984846 RepID=A0ABY7AHG0_9ALTE|nr:MauE/DoxX family redox-associated membrane protein [Catenovulum sp. TS8]WAJ69048.1 glutaredoxin family protein [Catenovulum sp. TS8]
MTKKATLYRMETSNHICPFGLKSKDLLKRSGYSIEDQKLTTREETDNFKQQYQVETTPQVFIKDERIGGYDQLRDYLGKEPAGQQGMSYAPVIAIFAVSLLLSFVFTLSFTGFDGLSSFSISLLELFVALSMTILAIQKLQDLEQFSNSFITYDLLAMKAVRYAYIYPFLEAYAGIGMIANLPAYTVAPVSLFIGIVGAISVFKAVYIDKRKLKCACAGGNNKVPLGFISLTENLFMITAGVWMFIR